MAAIPPSELILNEDGSIYHPQLLPEDVADIVLTVGNPDRVARVSRHFDRIDCKKQKREFVTHTGWLGPKRITVLSTGIGPDNIDIVLNELDALVNVDFQTRRPRAALRKLHLIRLGTSGGLQPGLAVDSMVCSAFALGLDNLLHYYDYRPSLPEAELYDDIRALRNHTGVFPQMPYVAEASHSLLALFEGEMISGITLTSPGFYAPQGRSIRLKSRLNELHTLESFRFARLAITNFEMETAALYALSRMLGHEALSCSVILANRPRGTFSPDPYRAVEETIANVLKIIDRSDFS